MGIGELAAQVKVPQEGWQSQHHVQAELSRKAEDMLDLVPENTLSAIVLLQSVQRVLLFSWLLVNQVWINWMEL